MLKGFFEAISNFLSSLFGGGKKKEPKTKPVIPKPPVDVDDESLETNVQDASEVPCCSLDLPGLRLPGVQRPTSNPRRPALHGLDSFGHGDHDNNVVRYDDGVVRQEK